ncbi:MAG TPA: endonuclease/exonuclease/phosphatase family protein [Acidimicrobiales bacterium]|nr:endonuclease/exonuclease/phosphatase family protein [Acidimicrobiales bacterium]
MPGVVVASFNVHGGVDGRGRPFDVVAACVAVDADVLVLQETWTPDAGESLARRVGDALGYQVEELAMARARMATAPDGNPAPPSWGSVLRVTGPYGLRVGEPRSRRVPRVTSPVAVVPGTWGMALLSRVPVGATTVLDIGQLWRDPARRGAIAVEVDIGGRPLRVVGTHMSHLSNGSIVQLRSLHRLITDPAVPAVLAGDMNLWGPPLSVLFPGWSRIVRGRTWPAWRPVAQLDHILVTHGVRPLGPGAVVEVAGSDHLPVRARLTLV